MSTIIKALLFVYILAWIIASEAMMDAHLALLAGFGQ